MMLKALPLVHFWSVLLLKEQMMTSVRKTLKSREICLFSGSVVTVALSINGCSYSRNQFEMRKQEGKGVVIKKLSLDLPLF